MNCKNGETHQKRVPLLTVISGPSGVGKDAIIERLPADYHRAITATTRKQRRGETHGVHHFFVSPPEFRDMVQNNKLLEWAQVYGNSYGVPKKQIKENLGVGKHSIVRVDVQGALRIREQFPTALLIFILPPLLETLKKRILERGVNDRKDMENRIEQATEEIASSHWFDYRLINHGGRIGDAVKKVSTIIEHEELRRKPVGI